MQPRFLLWRAITTVFLMTLVKLLAVACPMAFAENKESDAAISEAIVDLGSENSGVAAAAEDRLFNYGDDAIVRLRKALKDASPQVAARSRTVIDRMVKRHVLTLGSRSPALAYSAEASLLKLRFLAKSALEEVVKREDSQRAERATSILEKISFHTHVVLDALGQPIEEGTLELTITVSMGNAPAGNNDNTPLYEHRVIQSVVEIREHGYTTINLPDMTVRAAARIVHADYGIAEQEISTHSRDPELRVPLVKRDSPAYARAVKGTIVGPDLKSLSGARITCSNVRTSGGGLLSVDDSRGRAVVTNSEGEFAYYPLLRKQPLEFPDLVPLDSHFTLTASLPTDLAFFPVTLEHTNAACQYIELRKATRFHTFRFEDPDHSFLDREQAKQVSLYYRKDEKSLGSRLHHTWECEGARLLPGIYFASYRERHYVPLVVTEESPNELVFALRPKLTMRGRVVDGIDGKPVANAFVFAFSGSTEHSLTEVTEVEWQQLEQVPRGTKARDPLWQPLARCYSLQAVARTNERGEYQVTQEGDFEPYGVIAVAKNFLPVMQPMFEMKYEGSIACAADLPLFPAAAIVVTPVCPDEVSVYPTWQFEKSDQPHWFRRFAKLTSGGSVPRFTYQNWLKPQAKRIFVPAETRLTMELTASSSDAWTRVRTSDVICLKQGETIDIGKFELLPSFEAQVTVLDHHNQPVENVVVRKLANNRWSTPHITNASGKAHFFVERNSKGSFAVQPDRRRDEVPNRKKWPHLFIDFDVKNEPPADANYVIMLTEK